MMSKSKKICDTFLFGMSNDSKFDIPASGSSWHVVSKNGRRTYAIFYGPDADDFAEGHAAYLNRTRSLTYEDHPHKVETGI